MAIEEEITIRTGGIDMPAALALPESGDGPWPGVVVIHEILGLNDDIRRITARFADAGYAAVAPDLFAGLGPMPICILRTVAAYRRGGGRPLEAIGSTQAWLSERREVDGARIGVAGFCMGGGFALMLGARSGAGVVATYYGDVPDRAEELEGICPVISGYGGRDKLFRRRAERLEEHLRRLGVAHDARVYPDAGHGFMSRHDGVVRAIGRRLPIHADYNEDAAEDSWKRMLKFFAEHLGPSGF